LESDSPPFRTPSNLPSLPCQLMGFKLSRNRSTSFRSHRSFRPILLVLIGKLPLCNLFRIVCVLSPIRMDSSFMFSMRFMVSPARITHSVFCNAVRYHDLRRLYWYCDTFRLNKTSRPESILPEYDHQWLNPSHP